MSADEILSYTPASPILAALMMLALFALKSLSVIIHSGILYAVTGLLFPLPAAILMGILETVTATSVPYLLGRKLGAEYVEKMIDEHPKLQRLKEMRTDNEFIFVLTVRLMGLPLDLVSLYFGAVKVSYPKYLIAGVIGMLPHSIPYIVMGTSVDNIGSPAFLLSVGIILVTVAVSMLSALKRKKEKGRAEEWKKEKRN